MSDPSGNGQGPRIVIAGGGFVGMYVALNLQKRARRYRPRITVVSPENFMLYQPLLPEVASGSLEPRHAAVPLRRLLRADSDLLVGRVAGVDPRTRTVEVAPHDGEPYEIGYDHLVVGVGAVPRVFPVPGVEEHAVGFSSVSEALHLRNVILERLEIAEAATDEEVRRRALSVVFVGGGYTGVEALAELHDLARNACRYFRTIEPSDLRWLLVEATDRILPNLSESLGAEALDQLRDRGIDVRLEVELCNVEDGTLELSDGQELQADTVVWSTGVVPNPVVKDWDLPSDDMGRVPVDRYLRVPDRPGVWAAGDCAAVPDPRGGTYPPTAQHAIREGRLIAGNILRTLRRQPLRPFEHAALGELVTLGRFSGVGHIKDRPIRGMPVWLLRRIYYATQMPTWQRRVRIALDWTTGLLFPPDVVDLGQIEDPGAPLRRAFEQAASERSGE
jgi:NADH:ubiquinone reductase (H+-translocating)